MVDKVKNKYTPLTIGPRSFFGRISTILLLLSMFIVATSLVPVGQGEGRSELVPTTLKCEYRLDPLGIDTQQPRLSWALESDLRGQRQSAYRILVAVRTEDLERDKGTLWDSGRVRSRETVNIPYAGRRLASGQRCVWKVQVWDEKGRSSPWSGPAVWEMGLLEPGDWKGRWIYDGKPTPDRDEDFYRDDPAPLFRREFRVDHLIKRARLYISGLGYYEASLNGRRVGDHVLDPGWTDPGDRVLYSTYDVTEMIRKGENCLGIMVGNGWFNPLPMKMWGRRNLRESLTVGRPRCIAQLNIELADGAILSVATDTDWKAREGPIRRNNVYLGEIYDAREEVPGWNEPGSDDGSWGPAAIASGNLGPLQAQPQPPIRITAEIPCVKITEPRPGAFVFDFGQNFAGWARLRLAAPTGTAVKLRFGELLYPDGTLNVMTSVCGQIKGRNREGAPIGGPGSPEIAEQSDVYIARGNGVEEYVPRFTFHAFRYVELTGYPGVPTRDTLVGLRLNADVPIAGEFTCSHSLFNRIQEMVVATFLSNIFSVQSDCPHREKFGYGGDLVATCDAFMYNFDMATFYAKAVRDWHDAALPDGMLTDTAPFVGIQYCGVGWAMVHPLLLSRLYQTYGDRRLLEEQYPTSRRWLELVQMQNPEHVVLQGLSDHESLEETPPGPLVTPLYAESSRIASRLAGLLGRDRDEQRYHSLAEEIGETYRENFLESKMGRVFPYTQAAYAFALYLGLVPPVERPAVLERLIDGVTGDQAPQLTTGIFGTKFLLEVLSETGHIDLAYALVGQSTFPGWGYMLENGATTLWEHWEFSDNTFSHNHPMFGSVSEWFYKWLAGIQAHPDAFGFDRIIIRPLFPDGLMWVKAEYRSIRGKIGSEWNREKGMTHLRIRIPANTEALVHIPAADAGQVMEGETPAAEAEGITFLGVRDGSSVFAVRSGNYLFSWKM